jgi:hypothetical protein
MSHWVRHIRRYGAFHLCSADRQEQANNTNLNDYWHAPHQIYDYFLQVITFQHRILYIEIRELNLQSLAQHWENSTGGWQLHAAGPDLAAPPES